MNEDDFLMLSGIQHFAFCRRQWALIHLEGLWLENERTAMGHVVHERAHDGSLMQVKGDKIVLRGLRVSSQTLGVTGQLDVVEFSPSKHGAVLKGREGLWQPFPIEYKKGKPKDHPADILQLCAEAMCLEEMLCCDIPKGALYYHEIKRRENISFDESLRDEVRADFSEMREMAQRGYTPRVKPAKHCNACSLKPLCLPKLYKFQNVAAYYDKHMNEGRPLCENC